VRFVAPAVVQPIIEVDDLFDPAPSLELLLDGQPHALGSPVGAIGLHFLVVRATDASGNTSELSIVFEIRERPSHTAEAVVEATHCEVSADGLTGTINATILISAEGFDHRDILLSSVGVMLRSDDGTYINSIPIPIADATEPDCEIFQDHLAAVLIDDCLISIGIEASFQIPPDGGCPVGLDIFGVGASGGALAFEWGARTTNAVDPTPASTLLNLVNKQGPCGEPGPPPPPPPPPPCEVVETWMGGVSDDCQHIGGIPGIMCSVFWSTRVTAHTQAVRGRGEVTVHNLSSTQWCSGNTQCSADNVDFLLVDLVGDCCDCQITFTAGATVVATAHVSGSNIGGFWTATATASGEMIFLSPCGTEVARAVAAVSKTNPNVTSPAIDDSQTDQANVNCTVQACSALLMVRPTGSFVGEAAALKNNQGIAADGYSEAKGTIATWGYSANASGSASPCDPCEE